MVRGRTKEKGFGNKNKSRLKEGVECYYCHKKRHIRMNCPKLKENKGIKAKSSDAASVMKEKLDIDMVLSVTISDERSPDEWIYDSGCSYHMCPNWDWFLTYKSIDSGNVLMGNDMLCKTIGIRMIKIKMYDELLRTLTVVGHAPVMKNHISLVCWTPIPVLNHKP